MSKKAGILGLGLLGVVFSAHAQTSPYFSMAVPGEHNSWNTTPTMTLVADNTWVGTQSLASASGEFKFAANNGWTVNWGGDASIARVPALANAVTPSDTNLRYAGLTPGNYRFTFNDSTRDFQMEWIGAPLPLPVFTNVAIIGDFNGWTPGPASMLTNHTDNTNLWSGTLALESETAFQFLPDGDTDNPWGASEPATRLPPVTDDTACGKAGITLSGFAPGDFRFTLNLSNATYSILQTSTQEVPVAAMTVQGSFIATNNPPANMTRIEGTTLWESDHHITNTTAVTVRFSASQNIFRWGVTNGTPAFTPLPASGTMTAGLTNFATVGVNASGRYRITFNHLTGEFSFRRLYTTAQGINLLQNPGFEQTTELDGGEAVSWTNYQSWPKQVVDGFAPHSGTWLGAIHAKWYEGWVDNPSFSQTVPVTSGRTYRASAWFKATPDWTASTMQIKIEWHDASHNTLGDEAITDIPALTNQWVRYSVEGTAPTNAAYAHVVLLASGAGTSGTMHVDDAELRAVSSRIQNFDTWGALTSFGPFSPDWSVSSGKTVWNVPPGRPEAGVFISQYVEGTGNNKAVEIFNGLLTSLDLGAGNYVLQQFDNGSLTPTAEIPLTGTIASGMTLVVARPSSPGPYTNYPPDPAISGLPGLFTNQDLTFNGDDVLVLRSGGSTGPVLDRVGKVGTNATGSIWSRNTTDRTLTRKATIFTGTTSGVSGDFPIREEWDVSAKDTFSDLGSHDLSFLDPNEPYTPGGYSLVMNSGATLLSGELAGGIGDVSFWWRTESMAPPVTMSIASGPSENGPWTTNTTLAGVASSNFAYYVVAINRADHTWLKIQQTDGGTNRFRIDEITVSEASSIPRLQDFTSWTDPAYGTPGTYSRNGWTIQSASISPTGGVSDSRCTLLSPPDSAILSPAFEGGVGEVRFWAKAAEEGLSARLHLQTTVDGGSNWTTRQTYTVSTAATHSIWLYLTNTFSQARLVFDPGFDSDDVLVDNVEVRLPALYRNQNFDGWPLKGSYTSGTDSHQGWFVTDCIVDSQNAYQGQVARLNKTVGNYILSPEFPDGIGTISFRAAKWSATETTPTLQVQVSPDGLSWTPLFTHSLSSALYQEYAYFLGDTTNRFIRFYHSAGSGKALVDDIRVGAVAPRPDVLVTPGLAPNPPPIEEAMQLTADVISRYGASILSVTGYYRIANIAWSAPAEMDSTAFGSYASDMVIPALPSGTMIRYYVETRYAGIGAAPGSTGYSTNTHVTAVQTNYVPSVPHGHVWINEVFYAPYGVEFFEGYNHEFIELCGRNGVDISNWTLQLAFGRDVDIAANGGNPVYATYPIPPGTVFTNALTNLTSGFSFYVLGDQELLDDGEPVDQVLTTIVPTNVAPGADWLRDHIHDKVGVVRLLNEFGHEVYSLSLGGSAAGSERILGQQAFSETNSISLTGSNYTYSGFSWDKTDLTVGTVNGGQFLDDPPADSNTYAFAWHTPSQLITPVNTNDVPPFHMLDPYPPAHFDIIGIYYGYTNALYPSPRGTLYHRQGGSGSAWAPLNMNIREGSLDPADRAYVFAEIPAHTYRRLQTIEYVIEVDANTAGVSSSFLGSDAGGQNLSTVYTNFNDAELHPFTYQVPIADQIYVTNFYSTVGSWILQTDGNDPIDPLVTFSIRTTTNLMTPTHLWAATNFSRTTNIYGQSTFTVPKDAGTKRQLFYRIDPQWP